MMPASRYAGLLLATWLAACGGGGSGGHGGGPGGSRPPTDRALGAAQPTPQVLVTVHEVGGGSGSHGAFLVGDRPFVRFRLSQADGTPWDLDEMAVAQAVVSGPTVRYQRVIALQEDVAQRATRHADGSFVYRFPALPKAYLPPLNDSPAFDADDGELSGPLLDGTYSLGLYFAWDYSVDGVPHRQPGASVLDVQLGETPGPLLPRRISQTANCNQCHVAVQAHDQTYRGLLSCLLCHTAGAEDLNDPAIAGGTPGVGIDSVLLFHRLHNGSHLPSVQGIGVDADGFQDYTLEPEPLLLARADGQVRDASRAGFPVWPNRTLPMPETPFVPGLTPEAQAKERATLAGVTACHVCHGDPDGSGPLQAPLDGESIQEQLSRRACGACHDDVDWSRGYLQFLGFMPPQAHDADCHICHDNAFGGNTAVDQGHRHPLTDPDFNTGLVVELLDVREAGQHDGDGTFDPGESLLIEFSLSNAAGTPVSPASLDELHVVLAGPLENSQLLLDTTMAAGSVGASVVEPDADATGAGGHAPPVHRLVLPEAHELELVGRSSAQLGDAFRPAHVPRAADSPASLVVNLFEADARAPRRLAADATPGQAWIELDDGAPGPPPTEGGVWLLAGRLPAEDEVVVLAEAAEHPTSPGPGDGSRRLELRTPLRRAHAAGAPATAGRLERLAAGRDYGITAAGLLCEFDEFGAGTPVLLSYQSDFVLPASYPAPRHDSPALGQADGEWTGLALLDGTYRLGLWARREKNVSTFGMVGRYPITSLAATRELLVGAASTQQPYALVSSPENCNRCHEDLMFHSGRTRGFDACILCHGNAGAEDLPPALAPGAPATPGVTIAFRDLLHRIHRGKQLAEPGYTVVGSSEPPAPGSFQLNTYADVSFPAMPGGTSHCDLCHGAGNTSWTLPNPRLHPDQGLPTRSWKIVCAACHDGAPTAAHIAETTDGRGVESCVDCHGPEAVLSVANSHLPR